MFIVDTLILTNPEDTPCAVAPCVLFEEELD